MLSFIKDGVTCREAYAHAVKYVQDERPSIVKNLVKNIGFVVRSSFLFTNPFTHISADWRRVS